MKYQQISHLNAVLVLLVIILVGLSSAFLVAGSLTFGFLPPFAFFGATNGGLLPDSSSGAGGA